MADKAIDSELGFWLMAELQEAGFRTRNDIVDLAHSPEILREAWRILQEKRKSKPA
jgi:hypothetical protein